MDSAGELRNDSVIGRLLDEVSWEGSRVKGYRGGGRRRENVLTAEVLLPLTYLPRTEFLGEVLRCARGADDARFLVADEIEQAGVVLLPDESKLDKDGVALVVQPDAMITTASCHVLVEAKAMGGVFQPEQLAREYLAVLQDSAGKAPLLILVLDHPPPLRVRGHGRLDVHEAVALHLSAVCDRLTGISFQVDDLLEQLASVVAWTTWQEIGEVVGLQAAPYADAVDGPASTVRRLAEAVRTAIDWHTR